MNKVDKICKSFKLTIDYVNDVTEVNLFKTVQEMGLHEDQARHLLQVARQSIDEGYQKSFDNFRRAIDTTISEK